MQPSKETNSSGNIHLTTALIEDAENRSEISQTQIEEALKLVADYYEISRVKETEDGLDISSYLNRQERHLSQEYGGEAYKITQLAKRLYQVLDSADGSSNGLGSLKSRTKDAIAIKKLLHGQNKDLYPHVVNIAGTDEVSRAQNDQLGKSILLRAQQSLLVAGGIGLLKSSEGLLENHSYNTQINEGFVAATLLYALARTTFELKLAKEGSPTSTVEVVIIEQLWSKKHASVVLTYLVRSLETVPVVIVAIAAYGANSPEIGWITLATLNIMNSVGFAIDIISNSVIKSEKLGNLKLNLKSSLGNLSASAKGNL